MNDGILHINLADKHAYTSSITVADDSAAIRVQHRHLSLHVRAADGAAPGVLQQVRAVSTHRQVAAGLKELSAGCAEADGAF